MSLRAVSKEAVLCSICVLRYNNTLLINIGYQNLKWTEFTFLSFLKSCTLCILIVHVLPTWSWSLNIYLLRYKHFYAYSWNMDTILHWTTHAIRVILYVTSKDYCTNAYLDNKMLCYSELFTFNWSIPPILAINYFYVIYNTKFVTVFSLCSPTYKYLWFLVYNCLCSSCYTLYVLAQPWG